MLVSLLLVLLSRIPIEVNAVQKLCSIITKKYYHCRDPNYIVRKCLVRLDIRQLVVKQ